MQTQPSIPFTDPNLVLNKRVGIVNHSRHGNSELIWFSKPHVLIAILKAGIALFILLSLLTYYASNAKAPLAVIGALFVPATLFFSLLIHRLGKHNPHLELTGEQLRHLQRVGDTDTVLRELSARSIHSVSSEVASASPNATKDYQRWTAASPFSLYPSILVCAEPTNLVIKGPRRFRHQEVEFILSILDQFRRTSAQPR